MPLIAAVAPSNTISATGTPVTGDITVTTTADGTGTCTAVTPATTPPTTNCTTLRGAINRANVSTGDPVTITVPAGTYKLSSGTLVVTRAGTTIRGAASPVAPTLIDGNGKRAFEIKGRTVTIAGLSITNGNAGSYEGGAIRVNSTAGGFILSDSTIYNNKARFGGAVEAIGSTLIERSTFSGNSAGFKGGAIRSSGTLEVVNSTFTNNSAAERGGAISVYGSYGKGAISFSTFVDNVSAGAKGGGVDRYSGSLSVTGSVLTAAVNPTTGKDCNNSVKLVGTNFVGNAAGCSGVAPLTATAPGPVALGSLANNGGTTQTIAPLAGSVAIDAGTTECRTVAPGTGLLGGLLTVDQRGLARPSGSLASTPTCDLGAVEIVPLDVELSLSASTETPLVGAATIPASNIPRAVSDTEVLFGTSTTAASPIKAFPLEAAPIKAFPIKAFPIKAFPIKAFFTASLPIKAFPIKAFPMKAFPLDTVLLSDLVLLTDGGWQKVLEGTPLEGVPLQALTMTDLQNLLDDPTLDSAKKSEIENIDFGDLEVDGTPLATFSTVAFLLWSLPLNAIPLDASGGDSAAQWCAIYPAFCFEAAAAGTLDDATPASLVLAGESIDEAELSETPLGTFFESSSLQAFPMKAFPMKAFDMLSSPMKAFPIKAFPIKAFGTGADAIFDCSKLVVLGKTCDTATLGDVTQADAWVDGVTLAEFIALIAGDPTLRDAFDAYGLYDLLVALIPPESVPWEQLDLTVAGIQNAASPLVDPFEYRADITLSAPAASATLQVVLPDGFAYVPGGSTLGGTPIGDPVLSLSTGAQDECGAGEGRTVLTYSLSSVPTGQTRLEMDVRAGLQLGVGAADACVVAVSGEQIDQSSATTNVTVVENPANELPSTIRPLSVTNATSGAGVDVNLGYVTREGSVDLYTFTITAADANLGIQGDVFLSNLPADYDLVLYGPKTAPLRGQPTAGVGYIDDVQYDLNPFDDQVQADTVQDVPQVLPTGLGFDPVNFVPVAISSNRGVANEQIETGSLRAGTYYVQISAYNAGLSDDPYALRFRTDQSEERVCSTEITYPLSGAGTLPTPDSLDADVNTLFLVNEQLLRATYPAQAPAILGAVANVAAAKQFGVSGAIIPVDGDSDVRAAYQARFGDPCNPLRSNDVVRAIGEVIDDYTTELPGIQNIVIIGDDRQIPMANIVDDANFANESTFAQDFVGNNESIAALVAGMYRTDDPYGTSAGIRVRDHELFVPERAVGRLVETPAEIIRSLDNFLSFEGRLDPSTAETSLQTGYEFMADGAELNAANLQAGGYDSDTLINETWTDDDLAAELAAKQFDVVGIHGHFDQNNALPALDNANPLAPDPESLFSSDEFPASQNRAVVYSMGCHAGYSRSDIQVGSAAPDWAQRLVGGIGTVFAGNTGFGYGDSDKVALSESLTAQFATEIAQNGSIGQAWVDAKQRTLADVHVLDAYQEKVIQEFVFYGLPMFYVGSNPPPPAAPAAASLSAASTLPDAGFGGLKVATVIATSNFAGTTEAPNPVVTPSGSYYTVDGQTLDVNGRPIQPLYTRDISRPGLVARDALITGLSSRDVGSFDPVFFKAATDFGQPRPEYLDGSFPAELATVRSFRADGADQQQLLLAGGQFRSSQIEATPGVPQPGVQRLHTRVETQVYYGASDPTDITAPSIDQSRGFIDDGVAFFEVSASDAGGDVKRVYILFRGTTGTNWIGLDLTKGPDGVWRGGRGFSGDQIEFAVQAVDGSGNVAMSNSKSLFFLDADPVVDSLVLVPTSVVPGGFKNPWYTGDVDVAVSGASPTTVYSVDGGDTETYTGTPIRVTGNGGHVVTALDTETGLVAELYVAIDSAAPAASIPVPEGFVQGPVTITATFDDGEGSGVKQIDASVAGVSIGSISFLTPERRGELTTDPITAEGVTTVDFVATDDAGNVSRQSVTVSIDKTAPQVAASKSPDSEFTNGPVTIGVQATLDSGSPVVETWYTANGDRRELGVPVTADGTTTVIGFARDAAGNVGQSAPLTIKIERVAPVVAVFTTPPTEFANGDVGVGVVVTPDDGSAIVDTWYTANGSRRELGVPVTDEGMTTVIGFARDEAGNIGQSEPSTIKIDRTSAVPTLALSSTSVPVGGSVTATVGCSDPISNGVSSGVASCVLSVTNSAGVPVPLNPNGSLPTAVAGAYTATVTAIDVAGNLPASVSAVYTVVAPPPPTYAVCQLGYNPNQAKKVGSAFAITLRLCNSAGVNVSSSSIVLEATVVNPGNFPAQSAKAPGGSNPSNQFVFASGSYTYNLKTSGLPAGSLRLEFKIVGDPTGTVYSAPFKLKW